MKKYLFKCKKCNTVMTIETELDEYRISPYCPCGIGKMTNMASNEYAYGQWD